MSNANLSFASTLVAALADLGLRHACVSPGSRNTPLIAAMAAEPRIRKWPILDERSAGFFAVGLARTIDAPVALVCTSGTAAAEYHPAVVESNHSDTPLLVLTADRPPELRNVGAPQTIDQLSLYGTSPRLFIDAPVPSDSNSGRAAELGTEAWLAAKLAPSGPVHLNLPFREPLLSKGETSASRVRVTRPEVPVDYDNPDLPSLAVSISGRRGVIVAGRSNDAGLPPACAALAAKTGYPIFADPLSGLRHGNHDLGLVLAYGDALAAAGAFELREPDLVLRFGPVPTSKPIWQWLQHRSDVEQVLIDPSGRDATRSATVTLEQVPTAVATALAMAAPATGSSDWSTRWAELDDRAAAAIDHHLANVAFPNEPAVARAVLRNAPVDAIVTVGSSMPIRDVDSYGGKSAQPITVVGNRGANGIDGVLSSALGSAATGRPAVALIGDVSMFHDLNALGTAAQLDLPITIVLVDNDGGGIFHFLPQHDPELMDPATFETYLGTPHNTDFLAVADALGLDSFDVTDHAEFSRLVATKASRPRLLRIRTNRNENLALHRELTAAVRAAVSDAR